MSLFISLAITALALLLVLLVAAASSYSIPARHLGSAQLTAETKTDPFS